MSDETDIDWSKTTFAGSRREQLRRWCAMSLRQRLEALDRLSQQAGAVHDTDLRSHDAPNARKHD